MRTTPIYSGKTRIFCITPDSPNRIMAMLSFPDPDHDILFARPESMDDIVWSGSRPAPVDFAHAAGIERVEDIDRLEEHVAKAAGAGHKDSLSAAIPIFFAVPYGQAAENGNREGRPQGIPPTDGTGRISKKHQIGCRGCGDRGSSRRYGSDAPCLYGRSPGGKTRE